MTENDMLRLIRSHKGLSGESKAIGEIVQLIAVARLARLMTGGDDDVMNAAFSPHIVAAAASETVVEFLDIFEDLNLLTSPMRGGLQ